MSRKKISVFIILLLFILCFFGISFFYKYTDLGNKRKDTIIENNLKKRDINISRELFYKKSMELSYANQFTVDYYQEGYALITVKDGRNYLLVPKDKEVPEDLQKDIIILKQPMDSIYLVATAVMDMFYELDALDLIRFSGQKKEGWCRKEVQQEMEQGNIIYAGKYNAPDYERIISEGCSLAIENNMISHSPKVIEKLEECKIPVFIDFSSYENHPLGRVEWIKLYGVLLGREDMAEMVFNKQIKIMKNIETEISLKKTSSKKTVAFFFLTRNGMVNTRVSADYIPKMIELVGGNYIFNDLGEKDSHRSSITMQMEEFYFSARDADYLLYNSTIDGEITSMEELLQKEALLKDFKAVQENRVYCTTRDLYQQSMSIGQMIEDIYIMLSEEQDKQKEMKYIYQLL